MKSGKRHRTVGMEITNQHKVRTFREETYKYLDILEADTIIQVEKKDKFKKKEHLKRTRKYQDKTFKQKPYQ